MTAQHYRTYFVPVASKVAADVAMALLLGDDPSTATEISVPAVPASGPVDADATYYYGGNPYDDAMITALNNLATTIPAPVNGWPVTGIGGASVSEADALAAAATIYYDTQTTMDGTAPNSISSKVAAMTALGLKDQVINGGGL